MKALARFRKRKAFQNIAGVFSDEHDFPENLDRFF